MASERLQKILASAGVASRRKAEEMIAAGRVSVNGNVVSELGSKADLASDEIKVDGQPITARERHLYIMLYKPREFVTTVSDPEGRATVMDLVRDVRERIFPVGRLDYHSEGLLLLTNDGEFMQQLTATRSHVPKTYLVKVSGQPGEEELQRLRDGIKLPAEPSMTKGRGRKRPGENRRSFAVRTLPAKVSVVREGDNPWYEITLTEGRNRQIRRMFEEIGHHVEKIKRVRYGPLELNVEPGKWRLLSPAEVSKLRASLKAPETKSKRTPEGDERHIQKLAERVIGKSKQARGPRRDWKPKREWQERPAGDEAKRERRFRPESPSTGERTPRRAGGFERGPRREGGAARRDGSFGRGPRREGAFDRGPRRESGADKREGSFGRGPRRESARPREGGFARREGGRPQREGGFSRGAGQDRGFGKGPKRPGLGRGPRKDGGPRRGRS